MFFMVLVSVSKKNWYKKNMNLFQNILVSKLLGFETFQIFWMVSVSVSENFGIEKSIGIGFENFYIEKGHKYS